MAHMAQVGLVTKATPLVSVNGLHGIVWRSDDMRMHVCAQKESQLLQIMRSIMLSATVSS